MVENPLEYWQNRSNKQGYLTCGNDPLNQDDEYQQRFDFIINRIPVNIRTLDYGCGVGRYSACFDNYVGVDITQNLLDIAIEMNKDKEFIKIDLDSPITIPHDLFFTATVLQHCTDEVVISIFNRIENWRNKTVVFYENSEDSNGHVIGRSTDEYLKLWGRKYNDVKSYTHSIHGENHTLTIIKT